MRVFDYRLLRKIFGSKKYEVIRGWRKMRNEELYKFYSRPRIIRTSKSRTMMGRECGMRGI
jgi:hypothetical protein